MTNATSTIRLDTDTVLLSSVFSCLECVHLSLTCHCQAKHPFSHRQTLSCHLYLSVKLSVAPHLPPIWPLEQTWWVRGRVAHGSLGISKVLVVTAVSLGWFCQAEGTQRPGRRRLSPCRGDFSRMRMRLSHLGFQMKGLFKRQELLFCCCLLWTTVFSQHKEAIELWQYPGICSHKYECHAQTDTCMMCLQSSGTQWPQSHENDFLLKCQLFNLSTARDKEKNLSLTAREGSYHHASLHTSFNCGNV